MPELSNEYLILLYLIVIGLFGIGLKGIFESIKWTIQFFSKKDEESAEAKFRKDNLSYLKSIDSDIKKINGDFTGFRSSMSNDCKNFKDIGNKIEILLRKHEHTDQAVKNAEVGAATSVKIDQKLDRLIEATTALLNIHKNAELSMSVTDKIRETQLEIDKNIDSLIARKIEDHGILEQILDQSKETNKILNRIAKNGSR